jgi:hypothetical protein
VQLTANKKRQPDSAVFFYCSYYTLQDARFPIGAGGERLAPLRSLAHNRYHQISGLLTPYDKNILFTLVLV